MLRTVKKVINPKEDPRTTKEIAIQYGVIALIFLAISIIAILCKNL